MTIAHQTTGGTPSKHRVQSLGWTGEGLRLLDQTRLPQEAVYLTLETYEEVVEAIRDMRVRGAPAIGVAAAYALALAARQVARGDKEEALAYLEEAAVKVRGARPTAVNLSWAVERVLTVARQGRTAEEVWSRAIEEATAIHWEDAEMNRRIGVLGAALLPTGSRVLTHCNTGALATGGWGTALGVIRVAWAEGRLQRIFATESRPLLQGSRLTAWELVQEGIPVTIVVDAAAGHLMRHGQVTCVIVGADRIAANGDVANKIGTYSLAVLAHEHGIPFYVAAPSSTLDPATPSGDAIPIEERAPEEVLRVRESVVAPQGAEAWNPAFDVTPARYITAIITERGVARQPYQEQLPRLLGGTREARRHSGEVRHHS